jgi:hypothetical protein
MAPESVAIFDLTVSATFREAPRTVGNIALVALAGCRTDTTPGVARTSPPRRADTPLVTR